RVGRPGPDRGRTGAGSGPEVTPGSDMGHGTWCRCAAHRLTMSANLDRVARLRQPRTPAASRPGAADATPPPPDTPARGVPHEVRSPCAGDGNLTAQQLFTVR